MVHLDIQTLMNMQDELQEKYNGKWEPIEPGRAHYKLLWMMEEVGEVVAVFKKKGHQAMMEDPAVRRHFLEEMSDVLMYYIDILQCMGVTAEEFSAAYQAKHHQNMGRDFVSEHENYLK